VKTQFVGKATVEFTVGELYLMPSGWSSAAFKLAPLRVVPNAAAGDKGQVSVIVSRDTLDRLKRLGIEDLYGHFYGKVLRVSGTVELIQGSSGTEYRIRVNSLDQLEAIRKP
jgi:hypothetical protein